MQSCDRTITCHQYKLQKTTSVYRWYVGTLPTIACAKGRLEDTSNNTGIQSQSDELRKPLVDTADRHTEAHKRDKTKQQKNKEKRKRLRQTGNQTSGGFPLVIDKHNK